MRWPQERCQEALDGLLVLARAAMTSSAPQRVPGVVTELMDALQSQAMSDRGHEDEGGGSMVVMGMGLSPDEAGREVGLTGKHVRRLCAAGLVRHSLVSGRYAVDLHDLRRHLGGTR